MTDFAIWKDAEKVVLERYGKTVLSKDEENKRRFVSRVVSKMISLMIRDLLDTTSLNLKKNKINSLKSVRDHKGKLIVFSAPMVAKQKELRAFLMKHFYLNPKVEKVISHGRRTIKNLFRHYRLHPALMPSEYANLIIGGEPPEIVIKDYIAGMTDGFAEVTARGIKTY